jgi:hypothetical protein
MSLMLGVLGGTLALIGPGAWFGRPRAGTIDEVNPISESTITYESCPLPGIVDTTKSLICTLRSQSKDRPENHAYKGCGVTRESLG